jgi:hypothetical protein
VKSPPKFRARNRFEPTLPMESPRVQSPFAHPRCYRELGRHKFSPGTTLTSPS